MRTDRDRAGEPAPLAEIDVAAAPLPIRSIYDEIAALSGIPLPALIWRHLATYPGVLSEAWTALRPLYVNGLVQDSAWRTVERAMANQAIGPATAALRKAGLTDEPIAAYGRVLASYNRANPVNFVGVRLLHARLARTAPETMPSLPGARGWKPPAPITELPAMVPVPEIPAQLRTLIASLATETEIDRRQVVPSLYRHLIAWPVMLEAIHATLAPRIASGEIPALVAKVSNALQAEADTLSAAVPPLSLLAATPGVAETLDRFTRLIPEMIVIGALLERAL